MPCKAPRQERRKMVAEIEHLARKREKMFREVHRLRKSKELTDPEKSKSFQLGLNGLRVREESLKKLIKEADVEIGNARAPGGKPIAFINSGSHGHLRHFGRDSPSAEASH
jgi:hypothetical protein